jgi:UDP-glucose 4-epimerase
MKRALVLGGAGFVGRHLSEQLRDLGWEVTAVDRVSGAGLPREVEWVTGDLLELDLESLIRGHGVEVVFHLANSALVPESFDSPQQDLSANVATTIRALEAVRSVNAPTSVVFVSSAAVYGNSASLPIREDHPLRPISPYGVSKLAAEHYVRVYAEEHGVAACSVRPFSFYGPGQRKMVVHDLMRRLLDGEDPLRVAAPPDVSRDFVWIGDGVRCLCRLALAAPMRGEAYNLASGVETSLAELLDTMVDLSGVGTRIEFTGAVRPGDPSRWVGDPGRAGALGASCETPLRDGLARTLEWLGSER